MLKGVELISNDPLTSGGFGDIYKGFFRGQHVCLKVVRRYQDSELSGRLLKVLDIVITCALETYQCLVNRCVHAKRLYGVT